MNPVDQSTIEAWEDEAASDTNSSNFFSLEDVEAGLTLDDPAELYEPDDVLTATDRRETSWPRIDRWTTNDSGRVVMTVDRGMKLRYDSDGNYRFLYTARIKVRRHRWFYRADGFDGAGRKIVSVAHPFVDHRRGATYVSEPGRSREIAERFRQIRRWERLGTGRYWD